MSTRIQEMLGIELPIIQAPMAGVQDSALTLAVSNAGGLGSLPCAMLSREQIREQLEIIQRGTDRPYNVNFFCHTPPVHDPDRERAWHETLAPYYAEYGLDLDDQPPAEDRNPFGEAELEILQACRPPVVSFHFGLPQDDLFSRVKAMDTKILCSATTVAEARWLESRGVDAIIAQGVEAGGHRGMFLSDEITSQVGTFALLPQIVAAVDIPVIAAGGIASADGVAAALALGADAVQIGTAFLLCDEAATSPLHRAALKSPQALHTALTNRFSGRPARGIVNRIIRELGPIGDDVVAFPLASKAIAPLRRAAESRGQTDFTALWSGQNPGGCREIPAAQLLADLSRGVRD